MSDELSGARPFAAFVDELHKLGKFDAAAKQRITIALEEAITNSLEHGNLELDSVWKEEINRDGLDRYTSIKKDRLSDPKYSKRKIEVVIIEDDEKICFTIRDEGRGFDLQAVLAAKIGTRTDGVVACSGRGIAIMTDSMDEVTYAQDGREVTLVKYFR